MEELTIYEKYEHVKHRIDMLAKEEKALKDQIIKDMLTHDVKKSSGERGNFTISKRTTRTPNKTEAIEEAKSELQLAKDKAIEDGEYTSKTIDVLTYKENK